MAGKKRTEVRPDAAWTTLDELLESLGEDRARIDAGARRAIQTTLAYELAQLRKARGLSQVQLAAAVGMDQSRISRIERGDVTRIEVGTLADYARALGGELELVVRIGELAVPLAAATHAGSGEVRGARQRRSARKHV